MRAALLIAAKDLRQRLRDRSAVLVAVVVPLGLAVVFSLILGGIGEGSTTFVYAVADEDRGAVARVFTDEALAGVAEQGIIEIRPAGSEVEARKLVADGEVTAAFAIPAGFSSAIERGDPAELRVIGNVDQPIGTQVATAIAEGFVADLRAARVAVATAVHGGGVDPAEAPGLAREAARTPSPVTLADISAGRRELDADTFYAAGMAVFFLFFTVAFGVSSLLEERNEGTLQRLLAAPIGRTAMLGGKLLTSFVLGVVSMGVLIAGTSVFMGASWGNPLGVGLLVVAGVLAATGIMAVVATLARNAEQAGNWQAIIAVSLGLLGGTFFPVSQAGGLIAKLSLLTPHAWFLRGLADLGGGRGVASILPALGAILAFAVVTGGIALLRIGRLARP